MQNLTVILILIVAEGDNTFSKTLLHVSYIVNITIAKLKVLSIQSYIHNKHYWPYFFYHRKGLVTVTPLSVRAVLRMTSH